MITSCHHTWRLIYKPQLDCLHPVPLFPWCRLQCARYFLGCPASIIKILWPAIALPLRSSLYLPNCLQPTPRPFKRYCWGRVVLPGKTGPIVFSPRKIWYVTHAYFSQGGRLNTTKKEPRWGSVYAIYTRLPESDWIIPVGDKCCVARLCDHMFCLGYQTLTTNLPV